jgi:hypothetical protein
MSVRGQFRVSKMRAIGQDVRLIRGVAELDFEHHMMQVREEQLDRIPLRPKVDARGRQPARLVMVPGLGISAELLGCQ